MWAKILHPEAWTSADTDKLRALLTTNLEPTK